MLVEFLRGKQDKLPASGATNGTFYLTEDSKRLYVCLEDNGAPQLLNQTVLIIDEVNDLPTTAEINDFYYCLKENILAVYTSISVEENGQTTTKNQWVQINPDTGATSVEVTGSGNAITSVSYDASARKLTFTKEETFATETALIALSEYVGTIPNGTDNSPKANSVVEYVNVKAQEVLDAAMGGSSESAASVKQQLDTYIETNNTAVAKAQSTADTAKANAATAQETANEAKQAAANAVTTAAADATSKANTAKSDAISESKQYTNTQITTVNNRLNDVEGTINSINPMSYKGIINSEKPLSSLTGVSVGDTYMVAEAGLYEGESAKVGDLFIATLGDGATEENNIINGTIEWTYIPSGDETDTDTQYSLINEGTSIVLQNTTANNIAGKISLKEGQNITVEVEIDDDPETPPEIVIAHEVIKTNVENEPYDVIANIGYSNGHITSITGKEITSDNLTITKSDTAIKINLEWGTF